MGLPGGIPRRRHHSNRTAIRNIFMTEHRAISSHESYSYSAGESLYTVYKFVDDDRNRTRQSAVMSRDLLVLLCTFQLIGVQA